MSLSKQNMKRSALTIAIALTLMTGAAVAKGSGHKGGGHNSPIERMIEKLDLTDAQVIQVEELMGDRPNKRESRAQIKELMDQGNVDQAAEQAANAARERVYQKAKFKSGLEQILTTEQLAKMEQNELRKKKREERRNRNKTSG